MENGIENHKTEFQIAEFEDAEKPIKPRTKLEKWIKRTLLFVLHVVVGSYFGYATHYYLKESKWY